MREIAWITETTKSHVHYYMTKFGIERRPWTGLAPKCEPRLIRNLYKGQGKTLREISALLGISKSTARVHIIRQGPLRSRSIPRYWRSPFSEDYSERAFLLGYRAGDVNAFQDSAMTVTARVSTTHQSMLEMFWTSFSRYGCCIVVPRRVFLAGYDWQALVHLDNSFQFLIPKPSSPPSEPTQLYPFVAGFSDSDGCWSVSHNGRRTTFGFNITSKNHGLLVELASGFEREDYHPHLYLSRSKGTVKVVHGHRETREITLTQDMWTFVVSRKDEIRRLALNVLPHSRHREKIAKMKLVLDETNEAWSAAAPRMEELRQSIEAETAKTIGRAEIEYKARHEEPASGVVG